jgi:hypothetical protein
MIVLAISLLFTLVDRRQLLQARAPACVPRVGAAANAFIARCALSHRGLRMRGPQCVAKGAARVAMRCIALRCVASRCNSSRCVALRCNGSRCVERLALRCVASRCVALQRLALRCVATARDAMRCDVLRCRHLQTCSRAAHSLGAKAARPSCSWVLHRIAHSTRTLAHTDTSCSRSRSHNLQHTDTHTRTHARTHTQPITHTRAHTHTHTLSL